MAFYFIGCILFMLLTLGALLSRSQKHRMLPCMPMIFFTSSSVYAYECVSDSESEESNFISFTIYPMWLVITGCIQVIVVRILGIRLYEISFESFLYKFHSPSICEFVNKSKKESNFNYVLNCVNWFLAARKLRQKHDHVSHHKWFCRWCPK